MRLLDADRIRRRRRDLGLSQRQLAHTAGTTPAVIERIEDATNHPDLPLGLVARLADALALPRSALWADPTAGAPAAAPDDAGDAAAVGALLAETGTLTAPEALADALGWTLERTHAAIDDLDRRAHPLGWTIQHTKGDVAIRRRDTATDPHQLQALLKHHHARRGLTITEARLLAAIHDGRTEQRITGNNDRVALARLHNAGLIQDRDQLDLADDVRFSLMLAG